MFADAKFPVPAVLRNNLRNCESLRTSAFEVKKVRLTKCLKFQQSLMVDGRELNTKSDIDYEQSLFFFFSSSKLVKQDGRLINAREVGRRLKITSKGVGVREREK